MNLDDYVLLGLGCWRFRSAATPSCTRCIQRADAFTAADKLTKPAWLGITGASLLVLIVFQGGPRSSGGLFWLAALVAVLVYIVDVKPAVVRVQGGGQRW